MTPEPGGGMLRRNRALEELLQLAREVISDGRVSEREAAIFRRWVKAHPGMLGVKVVDDLARILQRIFADGRVEPEERRELLEVLEAVAGEGGGAPDDGFGKLTDDESSVDEG